MTPNQTSSPSSNNQRETVEYEKASLRLQRIGLIVESIGLFGAIVSILILAVQVREQVKATGLQVDAVGAQVAATKAQYDLLDASIYQDLMSKQLDLDKLLIENPKSYGYLFGKQPVPKDKLPPEAVGATSYHLDFFQLVYSQRSRLPSLEDENSPDWKTWKNTMAGAFKESPLLCSQLSDLRDMFGQDFVDYVLVKNDWCTNHLLKVQ